MLARMGDYIEQVKKNIAEEEEGMSERIQQWTLYNKDLDSHWWEQAQFVGEERAAELLLEKMETRKKKVRKKKAKQLY